MTHAIPLFSACSGVIVRAQAARFRAATLSGSKLIRFRMSDSQLALSIASAPIAHHDRHHAGDHDDAGDACKDEWVHGYFTSIYSGETACRDDQLFY